MPAARGSPIRPIERSYLAGDTAGMAKKPEPPTTLLWLTYRNSDGRAVGVAVIESRSGLLHARLKAALAGANGDERHSTANQHQLDMPTRKQAARQGSQAR